MRIPSACRAFTLIEVLVVITIIGVLVATLLPALGEARATAQGNVCATNIRGQFTAQLVYATDSNGRFTEHVSRAPSYYKDPLGPGPADRLRPGYLPDGKVFICPLSVSLGDYFADPAAVLGGGLSWVGGWNAPTTTVTLVGGPYSWFTNFTSRSYVAVSPTDSLTYLSNNGIGEPTWPTNAGECTSEKTVIAHIIQKTTAGGSGDLTHGFKDPYFTGAAPSGRTSPVGLSDGHVVIRKASDMAPRALIILASGNQYTHWY